MIADDDLTPDVHGGKVLDSEEGLLLIGDS